MHNPLTQDLDHILFHTNNLWEELRESRIFITGGTGFFGCWLLESFAWANHFLNLNASAIVLTRDCNVFKNKAPHLTSNPSILFHIGDVRNFNFPEGKFSHIIHAATPASAMLNKEDPLLMYDTILKGTKHTLDFAVHCGAKKFLLTSSGAIYGKQPPEISHIMEGFNGAPSPTDYNSAYGNGKRSSEQLCVLYSKMHDFEIKIARCFSFVGPYLPLNNHYAIGNFIKDGLNGDPILVRGDGTPYRSYLYAADLTIWLWTILFKGVSRNAYNVGSEEALSIKELALEVSNKVYGTSNVIFKKAPVPGRPAERYVPSVQKAKKYLNLDLYINLDESIHRTIEWNRCRKSIPE